MTPDNNTLLIGHCVYLCEFSAASRNENKCIEVNTTEKCKNVIKKCKEKEMNCSIVFGSFGESAVVTAASYASIVH